MHRPDRDFRHCHALVIDPNATSRGILTAQLRDIGLVHVTQCVRLADARRQLDARSFDFVLCEMDFPGSHARGDELLDDLHRSGRLPLNTVFVMVTAEATYTRVAEAAESALDSYLLKPFTAVALAERLQMARRRKRSLQEIFDAIEAGRDADAARLCLKRFQARGPYWLYAARFGAELLLRLDQYAAAQRLFESILEAKALPWARLGVARAQRDAGHPTQARRTLETLMGASPDYADAYDMLGRLQVESGQLKEARDTYAQAAALTPGSLGRQQKLGMLAFYTGDNGAAGTALRRTVALGSASRMFDWQSLVLLAFTCFQARDATGLRRCLADLRAAREKLPDSARLQRFEQVAQALGSAVGGRKAEVTAAVNTLAADSETDDFDAEAACNLLTLLSLLAAIGLDLPDASAWTDRLAQRFCSNRAITEILMHAAQAHAPTAERLQQGHQDINDRNEQALALSVAGDPTAAVQALLRNTEQTRNTRFLDTARGVLLRYPDRIDDAAALSARVEALRSRHGAAGGMPRLGAEQSRQPGGLSLRASARATLRQPVAPSGEVAPEPAARRPRAVAT